MSIAKPGYITASQMAGYWLTDFQYNGKIDDDLLKRAVSERAKDFLTPEQLKYGLAILDIRNHVAKVPAGLASIYVAAVIEDHAHEWNRGDLVGYTKHIHGTDCDVEVNLLCPVCGHDKCEHDHATIDIQLDEFEMKDRPWLFAQQSDKFVSYFKNTQEGFVLRNHHPHAQLMKPMASQSALWNSEYYLGVCKGYHGPLSYTYRIDIPDFITNLKNGQVFISYTHYPMDEEGYYMLPNYPIAIRATSAYLMEKMMWREWMMDGNQTNRLRWLDAKNQADNLFSQALSELEMIDPDNFRTLAEEHLLQDRSRFYY